MLALTSRAVRDRQNIFGKIDISDTTPACRIVNQLDFDLRRDDLVETEIAAELWTSVLNCCPYPSYRCLVLGLMHDQTSVSKVVVASLHPWKISVLKILKLLV